MQQQCTTALKNAKKIQKIKESDLNQKNLIFFGFFIKIMIFSNPVVGIHYVEKVVPIWFNGTENVFIEIL